MRIGFVPAARLLSETQPHGEALIATALLRALAARGHEIVAWCERAEVAIDGVEIREVRADGPTTGLGRLAFARRIAREVARDRFDVIHLLFPFTTGDGYALANGAPLVCGPVNVPWPSNGRAGSLPARAAGAITDAIERRRHQQTLSRAARVLIVGRSARAALPQDLHARCDEVPFGVDAERFAPTAFPDEPVVLHCGGLQHRKGAEVLVRAMPSLLHRMPRARVLFAGPDPDGDRRRLEVLAESLGVLERIAFTGVVTPADMPALHARATVLCQPSYGEPFGMTVIEAMASGRPVVGTALGGIPDAVIDGKGGHLVPPGDPSLLASALSSALQHAPAMGVFNRERVEACYSLARIAERIEQTYEAVLGEKERSHVAS